MPSTAPLFPGDLELGKRDDDHRPGKKGHLKSTWQHRKPLFRINFKKSLLALAGLTFLYYFFKNIPTDLNNPRRRPSYQSPFSSQGPEQRAQSNDAPRDGGPPSKATGDDGVDEDSQHWFDGPIKFYNLAASLKEIMYTAGAGIENKNVLFAASSLKSAAILLPLACEMSSWDNNLVHFALLGRDDISMDMLKVVNSIGTDCKIKYHDARPDFSTQSTDFRMEVSASSGLNHINTYMHPQAVIVDGSGREDTFFLKGFRDMVRALDRTLIELPENTEKTLMWITRLDASSLKAWNSVAIDIIIHAQPAASGSLMRLLNSLRRADYFMSTPPRLTIDLPQRVDDNTEQFLASFQWPPYNQGPVAMSQLTLHHRVPLYGLTPEENSLRFVESFWPANPTKSHVLVLSPQVEVSPFFFHYLKYTILEYKYSAVNSVEQSNLLGISLDQPSTYLNDSTVFVPPIDPAHPAYLWQAPNSNAALYFGDKWAELHSFMSLSLAAQHSLPTPTTLNRKETSNTYPSWLEHVLNLSRTRGYRMLYPNIDNDDSLVEIHNELYRPPEEYATRSGLSESLASKETNLDFTADPAQHLSLLHVETKLATTSLLNLLPLDNPIPDVSKVPLLTWDGKLTDAKAMDLNAAEFRAVFRREVGGCAEEAASSETRYVGSADDLFCMDIKLEV